MGTLGLPLRCSTVPALQFPGCGQHPGSLTATDIQDASISGGEILAPVVR